MHGDTQVADDMCARAGLVLTDRATVPSGLGDVMITLGEASSCHSMCLHVPLFFPGEARHIWVMMVISRVDRHRSCGHPGLTSPPILLSSCAGGVAKVPAEVVLIHPLQNVVRKRGIGPWECPLKVEWGLIGLELSAAHKLIRLSFRNFSLKIQSSRQNQPSSSLAPTIPPPPPLPAPRRCSGTTPRWSGGGWIWRWRRRP
jgi:hypothetical protein